MNKSFSGAVVICMLCIGLTAFSAEQKPSSPGANARDAQQGAGNIVAKVNGKNITEQEVDEAIDRLIQSSPQQLPPMLIPQIKAQLFQQGLDQLIAITLLKEVAEQKKITVDQQEIDEQLKLMQGAATDEEFQQKLEQAGLSKQELQDAILERMLMNEVIEAEVHIQEPTEEAIQNFYEERKDQMAQPEQVEASHILLKTETGMSAEEKAKVKARLEDIRKQITSNKITFEDAAQKYSDDGSKVQGGELGSFGRGEMVPPFEEAAFSLEEGKISDIVETQFGYHIIKVTDHKEAHTMTFDEVKEDIKQFLTQQNLAQAAQTYVDQLKEKADIQTFMTAEQWRQKHAPATGTPPGAGAPGGNRPKIQINPEDLQQR
ncbi:MAG: peptidylprolyl isomerase [bacterium]